MEKEEIEIPNVIPQPTTATLPQLPFILVTAMFFLWGIPNNLNDILIKQFMKAFEITRFEAGLLQSSFYFGYFLLSLPAALFMKKYSYKTGLLVGLCLYSFGTFLFYPAAHLQNYSFFLFSLFVIASGLAFLETGANSFITLFGDPETSERRLNLAQAFNPLGSIVGILIGTTFILSGTNLTPEQKNIKLEHENFLKNETLQVVTPYMILGAVVLALAAAVWRTKFPHFAEIPESDSSGSRDLEKIRGLFRQPHFLFGVIAQFCYVGAQVGIWSYCIQYAQDYGKMEEKKAGYFLSGNLVLFMVGRFSAIFFMKKISPNRLIGIYSIINVVLTFIGAVFPNILGVFAVAVTSFFMAPIFPTIFALAVKELGSNLKLGGSVLIMTVIGGAVITPVMGLVAERTQSMAMALFVPCCCFMFIGFYAFVGSKVYSSTYDVTPSVARKE